MGAQMYHFPLFGQYSSASSIVSARPLTYNDHSSLNTANNCSKSAKINNAGTVKKKKKKLNTK